MLDVDLLGQERPIGGKRLPNALFDPIWYSAAHNLDLEGYESALDHFTAIGFAMGLDPAPLVDLRFVVQIGKGVGWRIDSPDLLFKTLAAVAADSAIGWSARFVPSWLRLQLGLQEKDVRRLSFLEMLASAVDVEQLSPHPGLRPSPRSESWTSLLDALTFLVADDQINDQSRVDLQEYVRQHRDLQQTLNSDALIFDHMWSQGLTENRLKYLGSMAPRWMTHEQLVRFSAFCILKVDIGTKLTEADRAHRSLPTKPLALFSASTNAIHACFAYDPAGQGDPPSFEDLLSAVSCSDNPATQIVTGARPRPVVPILGSPAIKTEVLDTDLMSGKVNEPGSRVVYSINLGLYDHTPIPPLMEDCVYYLITDARDLPSDLPWRIVRPTLSERDRKRLCLWYKTHPHILFPDIQNAVWIDANVECLPGSERVLIAQETLAEIATFTHPDRDCIYEEGAEIARLGLDDPIVIEACLKRLRENGMPAHAGLYETNVLYSKPNDYAVRKFFDSWWKHIFLGSRRDQMSFTYAAFLTDIHISQLDSRHSAKSSRFFRKRPHRLAVGRTL